jgi:uncharacterized protein (DUF697 family)
MSIVNLDEIWKFINGDFNNLDEDGKKENTSKVRQIAATTGAIASAIPNVPFADFFIITPIQALMVRAIGNIYGYKLNESTATEILTVIGGGWLGQQTLLAAFRIGLPGAGGLVGSIFVYGWTYGMGKAAEVYFASNMTASKEDLKKARESGTQEGAAAYKQDEELRKRIKGMQGQGFTKEQIIYALWNVAKNDGEPYRKAEMEYTRLVSEQ